MLKTRWGHFVFLGLLFASSVVSRVSRTEQVSFELLTQYPSHCLEGQVFPCALHAHTDQKKNLITKNFELGLAADSIVQILDPQRLQVVRGQVWVRRTLGAPEIVVRSEYGHVQMDEEFDLFLKKELQHLEIYPLSKSVTVYPLGHKALAGYVLPAGYRSQMGAVDEVGLAQYQIPTSANIKGLIAEWAPLYTGTPQSLTEVLQHYRNLWSTAAIKGAELHQKMVEREIASAKAQEAAAELQRERNRKEQLELKRLFRSKNYLD
jgi:hypothetical protein